MQCATMDGRAWLQSGAVLGPETCPGMPAGKNWYFQVVKAGEVR